VSPLLIQKFHTKEKTILMNKAERKRDDSNAASGEQIQDIGTSTRNHLQDDNNLGFYCSRIVFFIIFKNTIFSVS